MMLMYDHTLPSALGRRRTEKLISDNIYIYIDRLYRLPLSNYRVSGTLNPKP